MDQHARDVKCRTTKPAGAERPAAHAYLRKSTPHDNIDTQAAILKTWVAATGQRIDYHCLDADDAPRDWKKRRIAALLDDAEDGDLIIVPDLAAVARASTTIFEVLARCATKKLRFIAIKQQLDIDTANNAELVHQMMILAADIERKLLSERTKTAPPRPDLPPAGQILDPTKSNYEALDERREQIQEWQRSHVSLRNIARVLNISYATLDNWIRRDRKNEKRRTAHAALAKLKRRATDKTGEKRVTN